MMTPEQEAICQEIKELHQNRRPLNITYVKREYPELMARVYAIKPYWGWRNALESAGIRYEDINTEYLEYTDCRICGLPFKSMMAHLRFAHQMHPSDYKEEFPDAPIMSEELLAARMGAYKRSTAKIPHWEALWSPEYVGDRLHYYHQQGYPLNVRSITKIDNPLVGSARDHFGSYGKALEFIGLNHADIHVQQPNRLWTQETIIAALQHRYKEGLSLNSKNLQVDDGGLFIATRKYFGSHSAALRAAGLPVEKIRQTNIQHIACKRDELLDCALQISCLTGIARVVAIDGMKKHFDAVKTSFFPNWDGVARELKIAPHLLCKYPTSAKLLETFQYYQENQISLEEKSVERSDPVLYEAAIKRFGSYQAFLEAGQSAPTDPLP